MFHGFWSRGVLNWTWFSSSCFCSRTGCCLLLAYVVDLLQWLRGALFVLWCFEFAAVAGLELFLFACRISFAGVVGLDRTVCGFKSVGMVGLMALLDWLGWNGFFCGVVMKRRPPRLDNTNPLRIFNVGDFCCQRHRIKTP